MQKKRAWVVDIKIKNLSCMNMPLQFFLPLQLIEGQFIQRKGVIPLSGLIIGVVITYKRKLFLGHLRYQVLREMFIKI